MEIEVDWKVVQGALVTILNPDKDIYFVNEGFGSDQLLFILEELARSPKGSVVVIEEPEIHLHPKAQFKFGQLAARIAKDEGKQLILVTHSEHIVSAALTSIKHGELKRNQVGLWFFEKKEGRGSATMTTIDENGRTLGGLNTFIETSIEELHEYTRSSS